MAAEVRNSVQGAEEPQPDPLTSPNGDGKYREDNIIPMTPRPLSLPQTTGTGPVILSNTNSATNPAVPIKLPSTSTSTGVVGQEQGQSVNIGIRTAVKSKRDGGPLSHFLTLTTWEEIQLLNLRKCKHHHHHQMNYSRRRNFEIMIIIILISNSGILNYGYQEFFTKL